MLCKMSMGSWRKAHRDAAASIAFRTDQDGIHPETHIHG